MATTTDEYRPDVKEFCSILREYALHGAKGFKKLPERLQEEARSSLGNALETEESIIHYMMSSLLKSGSVGAFLPAPMFKENDFKWAFFKPSLFDVGDPQYTCKFVAVFLMDGARTASVRFEPSGGKDNAHGYAHMQFTKREKLGENGGEFVSSQEDWLPTSYPGFALGYRHPIHFFSGLVMAIDGFCADGPDYARSTLTDALQAARSRRVLGEMERFFL